jgi:hypothetical protein
MAARMTRRGLMAAAAGAALAGAARGAPRKLSPSDRVNVAVIGAGGQGASNMTKLVDQNIVATCDVDYDHVAARHAGPALREMPERAPVKAAYDKAPRYTDYRRMFDAQKDIDAVLIATPDHHHAVAARMAMERGIHVYVQKPLTYTVEEGRKLLALAQANPSLVTQMGCQGHSGDDGRPRGRPGARRADRQGQRGPRLDQPARVAPGSLETAAAARAGRLRLADVARARAGRLGLQPRLRALQLARLDPVRLRGAGRHGRPPDRLPVLGAGAGSADAHRDAALALARQPRPLEHQASGRADRFPARLRHPLRVRRGEGRAARDDLVRRGASCRRRRPASRPT